MTNMSEQKNTHNTTLIEAKDLKSGDKIYSELKDSFIPVFAINKNIEGYIICEVLYKFLSVTHEGRDDDIFQWMLHDHREVRVKFPRRVEL